MNEDFNSNREAIKSSSDVLITYGDGWVSKKIGHSTSTIYTKPSQLDDEWVQEWIKRPY